jgi:hypothetical protein
MKIRKKSAKERPLLKKYGLNSTRLAKIFGYSNSASLRNSTRYSKLLDGIEEILEIVSKDS